VGVQNAKPAALAPNPKAAPVDRFLYDGKVSGRQMVTQPAELLKQIYKLSVGNRYFRIAL